MKKLLLLSFFAALFAGSAFAQETKEKDKQKDQTDWQKKIKEDLKLSDDQVSKWDALNKEYKEKIDAAQLAAGDNKDAQKAKKMELKKEKEAKLMEILTPEQQTKYKEMMEQKKKESGTPKSSTNQ